MTSRRHDIAAIGFATLMVFASTQGPVLSLWMRSATAWDGPSVTAAITSTHLVVTAIALHLLSREANAKDRLDSLRLRLLVAFIGVAALSTIWSTARSTSFLAVVGIASMVVCACWFQLRFTVRQQVVTVFLATQLGIAGSVVALWRAWPGSKDVDRFWAGIYYNPNSLAPVAAFSILAGTYLAAWSVLQAWQRRRSWIVGALVVLYVAVSDVVAFKMILNADSATWPIVLAVAAAAALLALLLRQVGLGGDHIAGVFVGAGLGLILIGRRLSEEISTWIGRGDDVSGRTTIWRIAWNGYRERPWGGWGINAAWLDPTFRVPLQVDPILSATIYSAHNGFLEVLLGTGPLGLLLLVASLVGSLYVVGRQFCDHRSASSWPLAVLTAAVVANLAETFVAPNHFLWLLLAAVIVTPGEGAGRPGCAGAPSEAGAPADAIPAPSAELTGAAPIDPRNVD